MAISRTATDMIGTAGSKTTITAGSSSTSSSLDISTYAGVAVTMSVDFGGTPDGNTKLEVLSSPDDSNYDTKDYHTFDISYEASTTHQKTIVVSPGAKYIKVKATNNDTTDSVDVWVAITYTELS